MIQVRHIETHVTHACNFTCEGCSHYSNDGHSGRETPESFRDKVGPWARRLAPDWMLLLGGEPTLNPDLTAIVSAARDLWPDRKTRMCLVTNGWFLHKHPDLPTVMRDRGVRLDLSVHHGSSEYLHEIAKAMKVVAERFEGVEMHVRPSWQEWFRIYKGGGPNARPFTDGRPRASWDACGNRWCMTIHEGKLWKCPPLAYLPMQADKFDLRQGKGWEPYLRYKPLEPTCTELELRAFVRKEVEPFCAMCPAHPERLDKPAPHRKPLELV